MERELALPLHNGAYTVKGQSKVKEASIRAKVIRTDGRVEDLGVVSYWHKNPLKRMVWWLKQSLRGR